MDLSKILSIAGKPGLYKLVGEAKSNIVVESLIDGKKQPAFAHERVSSLHEISIYTESGDASLADVLKKLYAVQEGKSVENFKKMSSKEMKSLFEKVVPDYDKEAVYVSDMKKVFNWYNILLENNLIDFTEEDTPEVSEEPSVETTEDPSADTTEEPQNSDEEKNGEKGEEKAEK